MKRKNTSSRTKAFLSKSIYASVAKRITNTRFDLLVMIIAVSGAFASSTPSLIQGTVKVEFVKKIWSDAPHNAFTDLEFYKGYWYCVFREAPTHFSKDGNGQIRIIRSADTETWTSVNIISDNYFDLRDPKITVTPKGRLMVNYFCLPLADTLLPQIAESRMVLSDDGEKWSSPRALNLKNELAWRIKWYKGNAYTISYQNNGGVILYKSANGVNFKQVCKLPLKGNPNEATIEFMPNGRMVAIIREEEKPNRTYIGYSEPPYTNWKFTESPKFAGGPNMIKLPDNNLLATFRQYDNGAGKLWLGKIENNILTEITELKSDGDCGYAGMFWKDDALWLSYYSTHEKKTNIYLAKIVFNSIKK
ncbi:MAG: exo-alpha-sialidase [Sphingobacteriales bacterium]|nr:MAG: exo-alpha-sialidase [Sphingobacteriales bacterium]